VKLTTEETYDSAATKDSTLKKFLKAYAQGLVVAIFGFLLCLMVLWYPLNYKATGFIPVFLVFSYLLGITNARVSGSFWSQNYRSTNLKLLGQGAVLLLISIIVLSAFTTVVTIQIEGGPQIDPLFQIRMALAVTLITPPFYGLIAKSVASWRFIG
jgi:hypothetical protein